MTPPPAITRKTTVRLLLCYCSAVGRTEEYPVVVLPFCSWPERRVSGCCATVLQLAAQINIRLLCYCSAVGRTEEYPVLMLLFCSWPHRRVSGCCATVLQLAAQKIIRLLCYCSAVGRREEEYPVPATAVASSDEKE